MGAYILFMYDINPRCLESKVYREDSKMKNKTFDLGSRDVSLAKMIPETFRNETLITFIFCEVGTMKDSPKDCCSVDLVHINFVLLFLPGNSVQRCKAPNCAWLSSWIFEWDICCIYKNSIKDLYFLNTDVFSIFHFTCLPVSRGGCFYCSRGTVELESRVYTVTLDTSLNGMQNAGLESTWASRTVDVVDGRFSLRFFRIGKS